MSPVQVGFLVAFFALATLVLVAHRLLTFHVTRTFSEESKSNRRMAQQVPPAKSGLQLVDGVVGRQRLHTNEFDERPSRNLRATEAKGAQRL